MMKKAIVTGANGFIGKGLVKFLLEKNINRNNFIFRRETMMSKKDVVLGAGIAGLGAFYANNELDIYEKEGVAGGLCSSFCIDEFRFDNAVHLSFTKDKLVKDLFDKTPMHIHNPIPFNWYDSQWIQHPIQNNLYKLSVEKKINAIKGFIERPKEISYNNFLEWNESNYGKYITEEFVKKYNIKYWCTDLTELSTDWIGKRLYQPSIDEVLYGSYTDKTPNTYYAPEMRYPKDGGYFGFIKSIVEDAEEKGKLHLHKEVQRIKLNDKRIIFSDGHSVEYNNIYSSLPLTTVVQCIDCVDSEILKETDKLEWTSVALVSCAIKREKAVKHIWFYIYDEDIMAARCYSPSNKAENNAPKGYTTLQFEIYFNSKQNAPGREECINNTKYALRKMGICEEDEIEMMDFKILPYANVIFKKDTVKIAEHINDYLKENGIISIGRFGEWKYFWSDQSFLSGYCNAKEMNNV